MRHAKYIHDEQFRYRGQKRVRLLATIDENVLAVAALLLRHGNEHWAFDRGHAYTTPGRRLAICATDEGHLRIYPSSGLSPTPKSMYASDDPSPLP